MSNSLLKKVTSAVVLTALVASTVGAVSSTYAATTEVEAANTLAGLGVIADNSSTVSNYRLGDTITRREMLKVMVNLAGLTVEDKVTATFTDLPTTDWGCKYAAAALKAGFIAANKTFRPNDNVSKAESLKMVMKAKGIEKDATATTWEKAYVNAALEAGLISANFSDYTTASKRGFVFTSAANAVEADEEIDLDLDDDTSTGSTSTGTDSNTTVKSGDLEVTLNPATPGSQTIASGAINVPVLSFDVTAGKEDASLSSVVLKRFGVGNASDVNKVYLYNGATRLTNDKSINSTTNEVTFNVNNFVVKAGSTETITVKVEFLTSATNNQHGFEVLSVNNKAVSDVKSNLVTLGGAENGTYSITSYLAPEKDRVSIGTSGVEIGAFNVKVDSKEDATLKSLTATLGGSMKFENLKNFKLTIRGQEVAKSDYSTRVAGDDVVVFTLNTPMTLTKSNTYVASIRADIVDARNGDNVKAYINNAIDLELVGATFGQGLRRSANSTNSNLVSIVGGKLTVALQGQTATYSKNTKNVNLAEFSFKNDSGEELDVSNFTVDLSKGEVNTDAALKAAIDGDIRLVDGNGTTIASKSDTALSSGLVTFERFYMPANATTTLKVVVDIADIQSTDAQYNNVINKKIKAQLVLAYDSNSEFTTPVLKSNSSRIILKSDDVVPNTSITGYDVKIVASSLTVKSSTTPASKNYIKGAKAVALGGFSLVTEDGGSARIDQMTLSLTGADKANFRQAISSVALYDGTTKISDFKSINSSDNSVKFTGLNYKIEKNTTKLLTVVADLNNTLTATTSGAFLLNQSNILAYDDSNNTITMTSNEVTAQAMTVMKNGTLNVALGASNPTKSVLLAGSNSNKIASFKFDTTKEGFKLDQFEVGFSGTSTSSIKAVNLTNSKGDVLATTTVSGTGAKFTGVNYSMDADKTSEVYVTADLNDRNSGAQSGSGITTLLKYVKAYGSSSNEELTQSDIDSATTSTGTITVNGLSTGTGLLANTHTVLFTRPTFALADGFTASTSQIFKLKVAVDGTENLVMSGVELKFGGSVLNKSGATNLSGATINIYADNVSSTQLVGTVTLDGVTAGQKLSTGAIFVAFGSNSSNNSLREVSTSGKTYIVEVSNVPSDKDYNRLETRVSGVEFKDSTLSTAYTVTNSVSQSIIPSLPTSVTSVTY